MLKLLKRTLVPVFLFVPTLLYANRILVDDRGDASPSTGGTLTLRQAIAAASPGDTILIQVKGTIQLSSPLVINKALRIIGPYPVHSAIDVNGNRIQVTTTTDTLHIYGVKITSTVPLSTAAIRINAGSRLLLKDCVLKSISNTSGSNNGGAVEVTGQFFARNCSFINNSAQQNGGAIYTAANSFCLLTNCTLAGNTSAGNGGAILNNEDVRLVHCTFRDNTASFGKHIYAISILVFTAHTEFQNCLFYKTPPTGGELQGGLLGGWVSNGGNVFTFPIGALLSFPPPSDKVNVSIAAAGLEPAATIDGYGLEYFRIVNAASVAIENGLTTGPLTLPSTDCRRAPRILDGAVVASMAPDAGAAEYTPYTVNHSGSSAGTAGTLPYQVLQVQSTANPGPYYIDFNFPAPVIASGISPTTTINKTNVFIDGYSCQGSSIPGPGVTLVTVTAATTGYEMSGTGTGSLLSFTGNNTRVHGLGFSNATNAIDMNGLSNAQLQGNVFGVGISLTSITTAMIGGDSHHQRNVFKNCSKSIHLAGGGQINVRGNFIGTNDLGTAISGTNGKGIYANSVSGLTIGGDRAKGRGNIVSGQNLDAMELLNLTNTLVEGNHIGLDYTGIAGIQNLGNGIRIFSGSNIQLGRTGKNFRNYIGFNDPANASNGSGIFIQNIAAGTVYVHNNIIGMDRSGIAAPNGNGIRIVNSVQVQVGDADPKKRNVVVAAKADGIILDGSSLCTISKNLLGINESNAAAGNGTAGIQVTGSAASNNISNNVISGQATGNGVHFNNAGNNNSVTGNFIGTDTLGMVAVPNQTGILMVASGTANAINNNIISGNTQNGIQLDNTNATVMAGNAIGLNTVLTAVLPNNANGILATGCSGLIIGNASGINHIGGNGLAGIRLDACSDFFVRRNFIGTNNTLSSFGNGANGIHIGSGSNNGRIGNISAASDSNTIARNTGSGIYVTAGANNVHITRNRIQDNTGLGISLGNGAGTPLPNDVNDADATASFGNAGQNYPVITAVNSCGANTTFNGTMNVDLASGTQQYRLDFYTIPAAGPVDASGHGEGNRYMGSLVQTPTSQIFNFSYVYPSVLPVGTIVAMTCSKDNGAGLFATSEFSDTVIVREPTAVLTTLAQVLCNGTNTASLQVEHYGAAPFVYEWYKNGVWMTGETTGVADSLGAGVYHVAVKDAQACPVYSDTITLTEPAALNKTVNTISETCSGEHDASISVVVNSGGTAAFNITFYDAVANVVGTAAAVPYGSVATASSLGAGTYGILVVDNNLCKDSSTWVVNPSPNSITVALVSPASACVGSTVNMTDLSVSVPALTSLNWDFGDGNTATGASVNNTYLVPGVYTIQLIANNGLCDDTAHVSITIDAMPVVNAGTDFTACSNSPSVTLPGSASGVTAVNWTSLMGAVITPASSVTPAYGPFTPTDLTNGYATAVITGINGTCTVNDTIVVTIDQAPAVLLGTDQLECAAVPVSLSAITASGNLNWTTSGTGSFATPTSASTPYDASGDGGTVVTVTLTASSLLGICSPVSDSLDLNVNENSIVNAGNDTTVCYANGSVVLSGTVAHFSAVSWTLISGAGTLTGASTLNPVYTFAASDEGTIVRLVLEAQHSPCTPVTDTIEIAIDAVPFVSLGADQSECASVPVVLNVVAAGGILNWTSSGAGSFTAPASIVTNYDASGDGGSLVTVTLTASSTLGVCPAVLDDLDLTVSIGPSVNTGNDTALCSSDLSYTLTGTAANYTAVSWNILAGLGTLSGASTLNPVYTFDAADAGTVVQLVMEAQNAPCAVARDTIRITIDALPVISAGNDDTVCTGQPVNFSGVVSFAATQSWTASSGGAFSDPSALVTNYTTTLSSGTDLVVLTSGINGTCAAVSDTLLLVVDGLPLADGGTYAPVCPGTSVVLNGSASTGAASFTWEPLGGAVSAGVTLSVAPVVNTDYVLTAIKGLCAVRDTVTVSMIALPDASFSYPVASFCTNDGVSLPSTVTTGGIYGYTETTGLSLHAVTGAIDPFASAPGTYEVYYKLLLPCAASDTLSITVHAIPTVTLVSTPNDHGLCPADNLVFSGSPAGGNFLPVVGLNTSTGDFSATAAGTGTHTVTYNYTDINGCSANDTFNLTVNPLPLVSFSGLSGPYCPANGPVLLTGVPSGGEFFLNGVSAGTSTYNYDPTVTGTDNIMYVYTHIATGCTNSDTQAVVVLTEPAMPVLTTAAPYAFCSTAPEVLSVSNPSASVGWYNDAALTQVVTTGTTCSSSLLNIPGGTAYVVNTMGSCSSAPLAMNYTQYSFSDVSVAGPYTTCTGAPVTLLMEVPAGIQHTWQADPTLEDLSALQPEVSPTQSTLYVVDFVISALPSCTWSDSVQVTVETCDLENIANAFSPNGDRVNDVWVIKGILAHPDNRVTIFNRWGSKLMDLEGYDNTVVVWDGRFDNVLVAAGTYYYVIEYADTGQRVAGWVQVQY